MATAVNSYWFQPRQHRRQMVTPPARRHHKSSPRRLSSHSGVPPTMPMSPAQFSSAPLYVRLRLLRLVQRRRPRVAGRRDANLGQRRSRRSDLRLIYGGGGVGLMGACASAANAAGGRVLGVMPRFLITREHVLPECRDGGRRDHARTQDPHVRRGRRLRRPAGRDRHPGGGD